ALSFNLLTGAEGLLKAILSENWLPQGGSEHPRNLPVHVRAHVDHRGFGQKARHSEHLAAQRHLKARASRISRAISTKSRGRPERLGSCESESWVLAMHTTRGPVLLRPMSRCKRRGRCTRLGREGLKRPQRPKQEQGRES